MLSFQPSSTDAFAKNDRAVAVLLARLADLGRFPPDRQTIAEVQAESLRSALRAREILTQAQGVIMEREHVAGTDAYETLHNATRQVSLALSQPARDGDPDPRPTPQPARPTKKKHSTKLRKTSPPS